MKKIIFLPIILFATFLQCSKDKNDNSINLTKGLLAVFKMNNEFNDSTGNIPITLYSNTGIEAVEDRKGIAEKAMYFDQGYMLAAVDEWSVIPITVSCWVLITNNTNDNYFLKGGSAAFGFYQLKDKIGFVVSTPTTSSAMASFDVGWVHLTGTYDGKDIRTYINGQLMATMNNPGTPDKCTKIQLGSFEAPYWKGAIDELRFYNRLLSEKEIALLANQ